jgi:spore coat protein U-like protein
VAQTRSTTIDVKAQVKGSCQIVEAAEINFNLLDPAETTDKQANGTLKFWCTKGVPYTLALDQGLNAVAAKRRMKGVVATTDFIAYDLGAVTLTGTGQGPQTPVTLALPATVKAVDYRNVSVGDYKDTLTVTVSN